MGKSVTQFLRSFLPIFTPPFARLWVVVMLYFVWCFFVFPQSPILRGNLPDPDDYMHLVQVLDWLKGQGWYDNVQHRLSPPDGVPIHFSRLVQLPMAAWILGFEKLGLPAQGAALLTAFVHPILLLGIFLWALRWSARCFLPREWVGVTSYVALFATGTMLMFEPGHIDHHGVVIILLTLVLGACGRLFQKPHEAGWAVMAGGLMALALVIALEVLPWLLIVTAILGLWVAVQGRDAAKPATFYALALFLGSVVGLLLTKPLAAVWDRDVLAYSITYCHLTAGILLAFASVAAVARFGMGLRFGVGLITALGAGALFLEMYPSMLGGPYGGMDPALAKMILGEVVEARPLFNLTFQPFDIFAYAGGAFLALGASLTFLWREWDEAKRWHWALFAALLAAGTALSLFYQRRFLGVLGAFEVVPLAAFLCFSLQSLKQREVSRGRVFKEAWLVLLVGPLLSLILPALFDNRPLNKGVLLFPAYGHGNICDTYALENVLRDPRFYGDRSRLIMNTMGVGTELLFRTPHSVLAAPYHMNVEGNLDSTRFFSTPYPEEAERIARRRGVDLVIACRFVPDIYMRLSLDKPTVGDMPDKDIAPHFIQRLMVGKVPAWLKRVDFKGLDQFVIYEVRPTSAPSATQKR